MEVGILGPFTVADGARPVEIGGARLRALLIRLAASAGGWVSVSELVEALWEGAPPGDEVNALQSLVSRLRRALPAAELIASGPAGYRLAIDPEAVDGLRFERLAAQGRRRLHDGHPEEAHRLLDEAVGLWRGPALAEVGHLPFAMTWHQRLEKLRLQAIDDRAAAGLQLGRHPELIAELEEVAEQHPLRERTHELLIRALAGSGRQAEALAVHERLGRRLATELGLDPPVLLQQLQTAVLRETAEDRVAADRGGVPAPAEVPMSSPAPPSRTNLRASLTSFVGRERELAQLGRLIERSRLVTLVGTGGAGKTRMVSEAAARLGATGRDGVWMVELAPVTNPDDVASTALGSIGVLDRQVLDRQQVLSNRDALSRLVETLSDHHAVLILDNCEHLVDAAAKLADHLLVRCPGLTVLATSREPLGINGESLWPVSPLQTPAPTDALAATLETAAVRLFIDRAAQVRPGFRVTDRNVAVVTEICRRLDGLPLAIELAAARLRSLPVEAVAARLGDRFRLLTGGSRTALPRHQTLRAVVDWSWELLTGSERVLAERLSVFPGGATAETADAVCARGAPAGADVLPEDAVADLLTALADKSLLVLVESSGDGGGAEPRYRMLETIREFAAEQLAERGETPAVRAAHARYFLDLAETAEPKLRTADQLFWLDRLTAERDNLLATLRFFAEIGDAAGAIRLGAALSWYWTLLGRHDEAVNWLGQALAVPGERPLEAYAVVLVLHTLSSAGSGLGMPTEADLARMLESVSGLDLGRSHPLLALVEPGLAMVRDDDAEAMRALTRNLEHPDRWARAMLNLMSAVQAENDGDVATLRERVPLALAEFREIGDRWGIGTASSTLSGLYSAEGRVPEAIVAVEEARRLMTELHASDDESFALIRIGMLRLRLGDADGARKDVTSALETAERNGSTMSVAVGLFNLGMLDHYEGHPERARRQATQALAITERAAFSPPQVAGSIHSGLATLAIATGDLDEATGHLAATLAAVHSSRDMPVAGLLATGTADLLLGRGDPTGAAEMLGAGVALRGMDDLSDPDLLRVAGAARAGLGPAEYDRHHEIGRNLSRAAALARLEYHLTVNRP